MSYYSAIVYNIDTKEYSTRDFENKRQYRDYIDSHFKYPSEYNLKYTNGYWNELALRFKAQGSYENFVPKSIDFRKFWDLEKLKCDLEGVIIYIKPSENYEIPLPCMYYWYLNYIQIYDKLLKKNTFAEVWDGDYHYFMYLLRCILHGKYGAILKKRQSGYTLKNMAVILLSAWFGESAINKIFSNIESHVYDSWSFLVTYREHINKYCGWKRGFSPDVALDWQIKRKKNDGSYVGNMSMIKGVSTAKDPSKVVGGSIRVLFGEEAGKNPTLDLTHQYVTSNVSLGGIQTGLIIYSGAVGELDKCEPLKKFILNPTDYNFLGVENRCEGDDKLSSTVGFFVPEWWNYKYENPETGDIENCYDEWGNTNREQALAVILEERKKFEKQSPQDYRHYCSQRPLSITEALDYRKDSIFSTKLIERQLYRIQKNEGDKYSYKLYDISRDENGKVQLTKTKHDEIKEVPFTPDKKHVPYGCVKIWELPPEKPNWGVYYAAVDPIYLDYTTTSESLFSIHIYKNLVEVRYTEGDEEKTRLAGDTLVASYLGRYPDVKQTNEIAECLIELYNAFTVVENNVDNFIKHMISKSKQKYLASKNELPFLKDLNTNTSSFQEYGVRTNSTMWVHYINKINEYIKEEIGTEYKSNGEILRTVYGVERIPDERLLLELLKFDPDRGNYDQIVTFGLVLALAKSRQANGLITKVDERTNITVKKENFYKTPKPFRNSLSRSPFKYTR